MGLIRNGYKLGIALSCLMMAGTPALAAEPPSPLVLNGRYIIAWSGITIGRVNITAREDASSYSKQIDTKTKGIGSIISDEASVVVVNGDKTASGDYVPRHYKARPHREGTRNTTELTYDTSGNISNRLRNPDDDPAWRPPVSFKEINTARDPITASFILRRKLYDALAKQDTTAANRTYDGARLAEMKMIRAANAKVAVMDKYTDAVNVAITRTPINGYTPKELKKFKNGDPEIHLYFSNDPAFLPIRATAKVLLGELSLTLVDDKFQ